MIIKKIYPLILTCSVLLCSTAYVQAQVLAKVNGVDITLNDYKQLVGDAEGKVSDKDIRPDAIDDLVSLEIIGQDAKKQGIDKDADFVKEYENVKNVLLREFYLKKIVEKKLTDDMVKEEYQKLVKSYQAPQEYKASHILVDTEKKANEIYAQLQKDKKLFAELAKKNSKDSNAAQGGDLGYFMPTMMVEPFAKAVEALKVGEISKPVKTEFGWHIIHLVDKRKKSAPSFEKMKPRIKAQMAQKLISEHVEALRKNAKIELLFKEKK